MNLQETKAKLEKYNQSQLLKYYDELDENQRQSLLKQIDEIDFDLLKLIEDGGKETEKGVITPLDDAVSIADIEANKDKYTAIGTEAIKEGKVAALLLAGGMGTRLGSDKPKGMYNIGLTRDVYIFEMLIKNLMDVVNQTGAWVPLYIMMISLYRKWLLQHLLMARSSWKTRIEFQPHLMAMVDGLSHSLRQVFVKKLRRQELNTLIFLQLIMFAREWLILVS